MKKFLFLAVAAIMATMTLTSCDSDNGGDSGSDDYRTMIANTRWQLSEVLYNNVWQKAETFSEFGIQDLRFGGDGRYEMKFYNYDGHQGTSTFRGAYSVDQRTINFNDDLVVGIVFSINISSLDNNLMEGLLTIWDASQPRHYTIRLKRSSSSSSSSISSATR